MATETSQYALLILSSLAEADRHGYAIKKDVVRRTAGDVTLGSTSLYRLLAQLLDDGLIDERQSGDAIDDPRRRTYRITPAGRRALTSAVTRLERVLQAARPATSRRT